MRTLTQSHLPSWLPAVRHSAWSPLALTGIGLSLGLIAGFTNGTFCSVLHDLWKLPQLHPSLADWGPALLFGVMLYACHGLLQLPLRRAPERGLAVTAITALLAWTLAYGLALSNRSLGLMPQPLACALAGALGAGLVALAMAQSYALPLPTDTYILAMAAVGAIFGAAYPLSVELLNPWLPGPQSSHLVHRIVGNMLLFTPWQGALLALSLAWNRWIQLRETATAVPR